MSVRWGFGLLLVALVGCSGSEGSSLGTGEGVVLKVDVVTGSFAPASTSLLDQLSGPMTPVDGLIAAASCHNVGDWLDDATLDNAIVVGSNPRLVRVAEIVVQGRVDARLALGAEEQFWRESQIVLTEDLVAAGFSQGDLDLYLAAVAEEPSGSATDRFVAYAVSETTKRVRVTYLDTRTMPEPRTAARLSEQRPYVVSDGELLRGVVERATCEAMRSGRE